MGATMNRHRPSTLSLEMSPLCLSSIRLCYVIRRKILRSWFTAYIKNTAWFNAVRAQVMCLRTQSLQEGLFPFVESQVSHLQFTRGLVSPVKLFVWKCQFEKARFLWVDCKTHAQETPLHIIYITPTCLHLQPCCHSIPIQNGKLNHPSETHLLLSTPLHHCPWLAIANTKEKGGQKPNQARSSCAAIAPRCSHVLGFPKASSVSFRRNSIRVMLRRALKQFAIHAVNSLLLTSKRLLSRPSLLQTLLIHRTFLRSLLNRAEVSASNAGSTTLLLNSSSLDGTLRLMLQIARFATFANPSSMSKFRLTVELLIRIRKLIKHRWKKTFCRMKVSLRMTSLKLASKTFLPMLAPRLFELVATIPTQFLEQAQTCNNKWMLPWHLFFCQIRYANNSVIVWFIWLICHHIDCWEIHSTLSTF